MPLLGPFRPSFNFMAITKEKKQNIVQEVKDLIGSGASLVFVNFHGLSVEATNEVRQGLAESGLTYKVAKKTLIKLALNETSLDGEQPEMVNEVALATYDPDATGELPEGLMVPKKIYEFQKKYPDNIKIIGGVFEGSYVDEATMTSLAKVPNRETLLGQLVWMLNWPVQSMAVVLDQAAQKRS